MPFRTVFELQRGKLDENASRSCAGHARLQRDLRG
jgi:hypothetical protein